MIRMYRLVNKLNNWGISLILERLYMIIYSTRISSSCKIGKILNSYIAEWVQR